MSDAKELRQEPREPQPSRADWREYERRKRQLQTLDLPPREYECRIQLLTDELHL